MPFLRGKSRTKKKKKLTQNSEKLPKKWSKITDLIKFDKQDTGYLPQ